MAAPTSGIDAAAFLLLGLGGTLAYHLRRANHADMLSPTPMPFKTIRLPTAITRLSGFSLLGIAGADAAAFLQAQTMNDVRALVVGQWHWNGWLNAKGRLIALFALLRLDDDEFIAVLPDFPAAELQVLLQRFVFRARVRLDPAAGLVAGVAGDSPDDGCDAPRDIVSGSRLTGLCMDLGGASVRRQLWLVPESVTLLPADQATDAFWFATDLAHGLPRLAASQRESWTPQMLSLERLQAFSLKKGCYPGQEIVARTHYLGQARRSLSRVAGEGLELGQSIFGSEGNAIGVVISASADGHDGLAVIQSGSRRDGATIGEKMVTLPAFLGGLERPA